MSSTSVRPGGPEPMPTEPTRPSPVGSDRAGCAARLEIEALPGLPIIRPGDSLAAFTLTALAHTRRELRDGDVLVFASKVVSRAEGRFKDLGQVTVSPAAAALAEDVGKDPRLVELILSESQAISRRAPGVLVVRHRLGFVVANAGIDQSNAAPPAASPGSGPWVLLLPEAPDRSAEALRAELTQATGAAIGVVISDSFGRPFRLGTVGAAIGVAGVPALWDRRGEPDLFGRQLEHTVTALGDQIAAAADLVAGQAAEGRAVVLVRGLEFAVGAHTASELHRPNGEDLYA